MWSSRKRTYPRTVTKGDGRGSEDYSRFASISLFGTTTSLRPTAPELLVGTRLRTCRLFHRWPLLQQACEGRPETFFVEVAARDFRSPAFDVEHQVGCAKIALAGAPRRRDEPLLERVERPRATEIYEGAAHGLSAKLPFGPRTLTVEPATVLSMQYASLDALFTETSPESAASYSRRSPALIPA